MHLDGLPTLGTIPRLDDGPAPVDAPLDLPRSAFAEAIRALQLIVLKAGGGGTVMLTSSQAGEGRTTLAIALGRSLALAGRRVLVVEADLRRPQLAVRLGADARPGLLDLMLGQASAEEVVRGDPRGALFFAASGGPVGDPQRLLGAVELRGIFARWLAAYDLVLVDPPAAIPTLDAALLADHCSLALHLVEWGGTPDAVAAEGIERLRRVDVPVAGLVLNKVAVPGC